MNITSKRNNVCAIIPFYNEAGFIKDILLRTFPYADLIIAVNDGSTDNFLSHFPLVDKVLLISIPQNNGKGYALSDGFKISLILGFKHTIALDADLQHPPELIPKFIDSLNSHDLIIGNRLKEIYKIPIHRIFSNLLTSLLLSIKLRTKIYDSQCGFRGFKNSALKFVLLERTGYEAVSEIIIKSVKNRLSIGFIDIPAVYHTEKSKIKSAKIIKEFVKLLFTPVQNFGINFNQNQN